MSLPIWKDFSKAPDDFLSDDYTSASTIKVKFTTPEQGVGFTVEDELSSKGIAGKVSLKWKHKPSGFSLDKLQFKKTVAVLETSLPVAGWKTTLKGDPYDLAAAKLGAEKQDSAYAATAGLDAKGFDGSLVAGVAGLRLGGGLAYSFDKGPGAINLGASYAAGPLFASLKTSSAFGAFDISGIYSGVPKLTLIGNLQTDLGAKNDVTLGGVYQCSSSVTVKGKVTGFSTADCCCTKKLMKGVSLTGSASLPFADVGKYKLGYLLTLG